MTITRKQKEYDWSDTNFCVEGGKLRYDNTAMISLNYLRDLKKQNKKKNSTHIFKVSITKLRLHDDCILFE